MRPYAFATTALLLCMSCIATAIVAQADPAADATQPCIAAPTDAACSSFTYPRSRAAQDIGSLCSSMPFMAACSVAKACNSSSGAGTEAGAVNTTTAAAATGGSSGKHNAGHGGNTMTAAGSELPGATDASNSSSSISHSQGRTNSTAAALPSDSSTSNSSRAANTSICDPWQQVVTVCRLDEGMKRMAGCQGFNSMCVNGSQVPDCTATGLAALPATSRLNTQVRSICEEMTMDGCERCMPAWQAGRTWADCDLLDTYSYLCYQMPDMSQCTEWHAMCQVHPALKFCYPAGSTGATTA